MIREPDLTEFGWDYALCSTCRTRPAEAIWDREELVCLGCADDLLERVTALDIAGPGLVSMLPMMGER